MCRRECSVSHRRTTSRRRKIVTTMTANGIFDLKNMQVRWRPDLQRSFRLLVGFGGEGKGISDGKIWGRGEGGRTEREAGEGEGREEREGKGGMGVGPTKLGRKLTPVLST